MDWLIYFLIGCYTGGYIFLLILYFLFINKIRYSDELRFIYERRICRLVLIISRLLARLPEGERLEVLRLIKHSGG